MTQVSSAAVTHTGLRREGNEDAFRERPDLGLYVVADGMGGHEAGEVASGLTVQAIEAFIADTRDADLNQTWPFPYDTTKTLHANRLIAAFRLANRRVAAAISADPSLKSMATTVAAVLLDADGQAHVAHVGDSRVYQWRDGVLRQLTDDHSWVGEQVRAGTLTRDDAQRHPWRNVVTRAISGADDPEVDVLEVAVKAGDRLLVCSDGLSSVVGRETIEQIVGFRAVGPQDETLPGPDPDQTLVDELRDLPGAAQALIDAANDAGGPDNITAILLEVGGPTDVG
jgi:serine/threonine protein phosphatase PrpC